MDQLVQIEIDTETLIWEAKLERAKGFIENLNSIPIGFEKYLREVFYLDIEEPKNLEKIDQVIDKNLHSAGCFWFPGVRVISDC